MEIIVLIIASLQNPFILAWLFITPFTIGQCWKNEKLSKKTKRIWLAIMLMTWIPLNLGGFVYALITYPKYYKLIPIGIIFMGIAAAVYVWALMQLATV